MTTRSPTPLLELQRLAGRMGVSRLWIKDEGERALGHFKSLGGGAAVAAALKRHGGGARMLLCASDGNHGLAVASAARAHGADARVYLPEGVSAARAARIAAVGGEIAWVAGTYDDAVDQARRAADGGQGLLIPDTSPHTDDVVVADVLAGYGRIAEEIVSQVGDGDPTHLFVQAGVGGLAAAMVGGLVTRWRDMRFIVVEPENAACVSAGLAAGYPVQVAGDLATHADMLSCGRASAGALAILLAARCRSIVVSEDALLEAVRILRACGGPDTTASGAAGLAGALRVRRDPDLAARFALSASSRVLLVATERLQAGD